MDNVDSGIVTEPLLDRNIGLNYSQTMTPEEKVNYLVQNLRLTIHNHKQLLIMTGSGSLSYKKYPFLKNEYDITNDDFEGEGEAVVDLLRRLNWEKEGITFEKYDLKNLSEFFKEEQSELKLDLEKNKHSISIVTIDGEKYIIDCAYRQFFTLKDGLENKKIEQYDLSKNLLTDEDKKFAEQILKYGWIKATPENVKKYMDMFIKNISKDEKIVYPTEQEYIERIKGEQIDEDITKKQTIEICNLSKGLKPYYMDLIQKEKDTSKISSYQKIIDILDSKDRGFHIIKKEGREYIKSLIGSFKLNGVENINEQLRTKIKIVLEKAYREELEFSEDSLALYINAFLILASGDKDVVTPNIEEYYKILDIGDLEKYIIDSKPYIIDEVYKEFDEKMSVEEKLTSVVQKERRFLMRDRNLETSSLIGDCEDSTARVTFDCASKGFKDMCFLYPGNYLNSEVKGHNCTIVNMEGKSFLIDCTYRQFFMEKEKNKKPRNIYDRQSRKKKSSRTNIKIWMD